MQLRFVYINRDGELSDMKRRCTVHCQALWVRLCLMTKGDICTEININKHDTYHDGNDFQDIFYR